MEFRRNHALISGMGAPPTDEETKDESLNSVDIRCRKMNERGMRAEHRPSVRGGGGRLNAAALCREGLKLFWRSP